MSTDTLKAHYNDTLGNKPLSAQLTIHYRQRDLSDPESAYTQLHNTNTNTNTNIHTCIPISNIDTDTGDNIEVIQTVLDIGPDQLSEFVSTAPSNTSLNSNYSYTPTTTNSDSRNSSFSAMDSDVNELYQCMPEYSTTQQHFIVRRFSETQLDSTTPNMTNITGVATFAADHDNKVTYIPRSCCGNHSDIDLKSCPCTKHHHRRNSIAIRFNKALYKKV